MVVVVVLFDAFIVNVVVVDDDDFVVVAVAAAWCCGVGLFLYVWSVRVWFGLRLVCPCVVLNRIESRGTV